MVNTRIQIKLITLKGIDQVSTGDEMSRISMY